MKLFLFILCSLFGWQLTSEQKIAEDCLSYLTKPHEHQDTGKHLTTNAALFFCHKPYVGGTLEINDEEALVVNLNAFDCTTLVETCLAMSVCTQHKQTDFDSYKNILQKIRYRNGEIEGYLSRLHYASDWIFENERSGFIQDITKDIGGKKRKLHINYMSSHSSAYKQLKENPANIQEIQKIESAINTREHYYIPKEEILSCENMIQDGDIIFFATSIAGLDFTHTGIAHWKDGDLTFIHASSQAKQVIVNPQPLRTYCANQKRNIGIVVCRCVL